MSFLKPSNTIFLQKKLVILGTGWGTHALARTVDRKLFDVTIVSPRNHFLFTPLLASTTVGTLELRSITESVREWGGFKDDRDFHLAEATDVDVDKKQLSVKSRLDDKIRYTIDYDILCVAVGARSNTFNVPGVKPHAYFLKQVAHAQKIRARIIELLEIAESPTLTDEDRKKMLNIVVVGGGPTGVEFSAELFDFINKDVKKHFTHLVPFMNVTLIEAGKILSMFDEGLRIYAEGILSKRKRMKVMREQVAEVFADGVKLKNGTIIPCGMTIWSAGIGPTPFVEGLEWPKRSTRILTDSHFHVKGLEDKSVFAFGDCATTESV
jgi:NADH:ubiquinone reductase (non-electrogenic)